MTLRTIALITVATFFCVACDNRPEQGLTESLTRNVGSADRQKDSTSDFITADTLHEPEQVGIANQKDQNDLIPKLVEWDKKIVKNAKLNAEIKDFKTFSQQLREKVKKYGGYVSQEEQSQSDYQIQNSVVIKVPVDQFENAINELTKDVSKLNERVISSEDVTSQLVDGRSRLEAKKQVRIRYLDLLKQAKNMEEILAVQKEINDIQEDIELVNGRLNTLSRESAMSTINFTFFQVINPEAKAAGEKESGFLDKVKKSFANGWYWIGEVFIGLISIWPLLTVVILGILLFKRKQMPKIKADSNAP